MKILVIHASAGAGHMKAAEALYEGLEKHTSHEAVLIDALNYTSPFFKKFYRSTYLFLISRLPSLWGLFFAITDVPFLQPLVHLVRRLYNTVNASALHAYLEGEQFDYIFATHFMPVEVAAAMKRAKRITSKLVTVVTDFDVHKIWLAGETDMYTVASDWTKRKLETLGPPAEKIHAYGIPTLERFSLPRDQAYLKGQLGLNKDTFTVLIATGSFGIGPIAEILEALDDFQVLVVCGHNRRLFERLNRNPKDSIKVLGLVENMHELMTVADVMVTKPGGLSISEALVSQLPLVFFNAIPGQEAGNVRVLREYGIGVQASSVKDIVAELEKMRASRDVYLAALKRTQLLAHPSSVRDILGLII